MLNALKKLISSDREDDSKEPDDSQLLPLAAAMLLLEVAWADHDITDAEIDLVKKNLQSLFNLPADLTAGLVDRARHRLDTSVGLYDYTRTINETFDTSEKYELMVALWKLALSDEHLDSVEEHVIRGISELLYIPHAQFIRAKQEARDGR